MTADLSIVEEAVQKRVSGLSIDLGSYSGKRQLSPTTVTVTALVPRSLARERKDLSSLFQATVVDDNEAGQMTVKVVPRHGLSGPIQIVKVEPLVVTFTVSSEEATDPPSPSSLQEDATEKK